MFGNGKSMNSLFEKWRALDTQFVSKYLSLLAGLAYSSNSLILYNQDGLGATAAEELRRKAVL